MMLEFTVEFKILEHLSIAQLAELCRLGKIPTGNVAQWLERNRCEIGVAGSNPVIAVYTSYKNIIRTLISPFWVNGSNRENSTSMRADEGSIPSSSVYRHKQQYLYKIT